MCRARIFSVVDAMAEWMSVSVAAATRADTQALPLTRLPGNRGDVLVLDKRVERLDFLRHDRV